MRIFLDDFFEDVIVMIIDKTEVSKPVEREGFFLVKFFNLLNITSFCNVTLIKGQGTETLVNKVFKVKSFYLIYIYVLCSRLFSFMYIHIYILARLLCFIVFS